MGDIPRGNRPLSPHLSVYKLPIAAITSIMTRITGQALVAGLLLVVWWLVAAAYGPEQFATVQGFIGSWIGQLLLWGFTFALFYHLGNGVRHLAWDFGWGFELDRLRTSGLAVLVFAGVATLFTLIAAYSVGG